MKIFNINNKRVKLIFIITISSMCIILSGFAILKVCNNTLDKKKRVENTMNQNNENVDIDLNKNGLTNANKHEDHSNSNIRFKKRKTFENGITNSKLKSKTAVNTDGLINNENSEPTSNNIAVFKHPIRSNQNKAINYNGARDAIDYYNQTISYKKFSFAEYMFPESRSLKLYALFYNIYLNTLDEMRFQNMELRTKDQTDFYIKRAAKIKRVQNYIDNKRQYQCFTNFTNGETYNHYINELVSAIHGSDSFKTYKTNLVIKFRVCNYSIYEFEIFYIGKIIKIDQLQFIPLTAYIFEDKKAFTAIIRNGNGDFCGFAIANNTSLGSKNKTYLEKEGSKSKRDAFTTINTTFKKTLRSKAEEVFLHFNFIHEEIYEIVTYFNPQNTTNFKNKNSRSSLGDFTKIKEYRFFTGIDEVEADSEQKTFMKQMKFNCTYFFHTFRKNLITNEIITYKIAIFSNDSICEMDFYKYIPYHNGEDDIGKYFMSLISDGNNNLSGALVAYYEVLNKKK